MLVIDSVSETLYLTMRNIGSHGDRPAEWYTLTINIKAKIVLFGMDFDIQVEPVL